MVAKSGSSMSDKTKKVEVPFKMTHIEENLSWKVWSEQLARQYSQVDMWIIGDLSGKIWAQSIRQQNPLTQPEDTEGEASEVTIPIGAVEESETQKSINGVKNQSLIRSTGITLGGEYLGFVQGNNTNMATFRSDKACAGVTLLRNNFIIAISFSSESFPPKFYQQVKQAADSVKLLWY
ncbi:uncharacterized protein LOC134842732 isoform X2 [Symsagittifera roscoffensis]|uniref:uncharacterized protein LOC134842732 isoform X2 n=1 Tax=Symsagittifera roscoffensis TaxID=84072 RepID=UPI00307BD221